MDNDWGPHIIEDENGEWEIDEHGVKRVPMQTHRSSTSSGFTTYDTSRGHCALCGSLTCNGSCFK